MTVNGCCQWVCEREVQSYAHVFRVLGFLDRIALADDAQHALLATLLHLA